MNNFSIEYIIGFLIFSNVIYTWYNTTISEKILSIFIKSDNKILMYNDFMDLIYEKNKFISELLSCQICFGHWISLIISFIMSLIFDISYFYILVSMFSWPSLYYKLYNK
jgi:hypothetical protein